MIGTPPKKLLLPLALCVLGLTALTACETDDSMPRKPRTAHFLTPDPEDVENAEKRELQKTTPDVPGIPRTDATPTPAATTSTPIAATPRTWERTVVTLDSTPAAAPMPAPAANTPTPAHQNPSGNPMNDIARGLGYKGPNDWQAFGNTLSPMDTHTRDNYPAAIPHIPPNPGSQPMLGIVPAPSGDWNIENSWGQGTVLENYPHRPWPELTVTYRTGEVKHNPLYYFEVKPHLEPKKYIQEWQKDVTDKNYKSQWFYLNSVGMPLWVVLEPPEVPYVSPAVQHVEKKIDPDWLEMVKSDVVEVPWFGIQTLLLPLNMALEPPLIQRISEHPSQDPNFLGHLPRQGPIVPAPEPGILRWNYPFLNPDGTVKMVTPAIVEEPIQPFLGPATAPESAPAKP